MTDEQLTKIKENDALLDVMTAALDEEEKQFQEVQQRKTQLDIEKMEKTKYLGKYLK